MKEKINLVRSLGLGCVLFVLFALPVEAFLLRDNILCIPVVLLWILILFLTWQPRKQGGPQNV